MQADLSQLSKNSGTLCDEDCSPSNRDGKCHSSCLNFCPEACKYACVDPLPRYQVTPPPPPPPPPPPRPRLPIAPPVIIKHETNHLIATSMIIMGCLLGASVIVCILATILRVKHNRNSRRSRTSSPLFFGTQVDFLDEDQAPELDHPIWYINTVGLQQSVIDSITVFKYQKDEGLIEGTECSVCLNEFQEDESLRLLPKCSHAFHIPCIDTWLRSHKNCPLCRAPIVSANFEVQVELSVPASSDLSSNGESHLENSENNNGSMVISNQVGEDGSSEVRNGDDLNCALPIEDEANGGNPKIGSNISMLRDHCRVQSDLVDARLSVETDMQPLRRSLSLDSPSAMAIYSSVANIVAGKQHQRNLDAQIVQQKHLKSKNVSKRGGSNNGSISFGKLMKSSSIGHALQKAPISMKRSSSSSGKSSSSASRHTRSQDSILPL